MNERLQFLRKVLTQSNMYIPRVLADKIWHILVKDCACQWDREICFVHFQMMFTKDDLQPEDMRTMFTKNVLALDPTRLKVSAFRCFQSCFEKVNYSNVQEHAQPLISQVVGLNPFLWRVALECPDISIASEAIELLKRVHIELSEEDGVRSKFVDASLRRLLVAHRALAGATTDSQRISLCRTIERILTLLNSTVADCDTAFKGNRVYAPHGASFEGARLDLYVSARYPDDRNTQIPIQAHSNQTVSSLRSTIAARLKQSEDSVKLTHVDGHPVQDETSTLLHNFGINASSSVTVDVASLNGETLESSAEGGEQQAETELPGFLISSNEEKFDCLLELAQRKEKNICMKAAELIAAIPTRQTLTHSLTERVTQGGATARSAVEDLLQEKTMFELLYNVQVLCSQMLPGTQQLLKAETAKQFKKLFISLGGINILFSILGQPTRAGLELEHQRSMLRLCMRMLQNLLWHSIQAPQEGFTANKEDDGTRAEYNYRKQQSAQYLSSVSADEQVNTLVQIAWSAGTGRWHCGADFQRVLPADTEVSNADRWLALDAMSFLSIVLQVLDGLRQTVFQNHQIQEFVKEVLLVSSDQLVRVRAWNSFKCLISDDTTFSHMHDITVSMLENVEVHSATCSEYFGLFCDLFSMLPRRLPEGSAEAVLERQIQLLFARGSVQRDPEQSVDSDDRLLSGRLQLTTALLSRLPGLKRAVGDQLIEIVMNEFLFPASKLLLEVREGAQMPQRLPSDASGLPPMVGEITNGSDIPDISQKCRSALARQAAQKLLLGLATQCSQNYERIIEAIYHLHYHAEDMLSGFEQSPDVDARPPSGYVGLKNAGATCYMNSVLQQLYMQPELRAGLLRCRELEGAEALESIVYHVKSGFESLQRSKMQSYTPTGTRTEKF